MKNTFGSDLSLTIFGESHGRAVGAVLDGMAAGVPVDESFLAACMDIKGIPQMMLGHNGAFDMPTGSAFAPRGCPAGFALFFGLPQNEVCRIFLCIINRNTLRCARNQLIQIFSGKLAIFREFL